MASLCCTGTGRLLLSSCRGYSIPADCVRDCVNLILRKDHNHGLAGGKNELGALRSILSRRGAGVARELRFLAECSQTQTVVSVEAKEEAKVICEACRGLGFRICDYCEGEKVDVPVKGRNNRFHRRCPECRAVGIMMCYRCKVFKCVTFPDWDDGSLDKER